MRLNTRDIDQVLTNVKIAQMKHIREDERALRQLEEEQTNMEKRQMQEQERMSEELRQLNKEVEAARSDRGKNKDSGSKRSACCSVM